MTNVDDSKAAKLGKYGAYLLPEPTQQCGYIMATMSVIMLIAGATLETLSLAKLYKEYRVIEISYGSYSYIAYSGYWAGAIILACAIVAIRAASHPSDKMVAATMIASMVGLAFCLITIILPAAEWGKVDNLNEYCKKCSAGQMMLAAYSVMLATGSLASLGAILLGIITMTTIRTARRASATVLGVTQTMMQADL